jgi:protein-S-isoprenylcysteine O-methyltransferase Ste14
MQAGPAAETRPLQKFIIMAAFVTMAAMIVMSVLDHRLGWSSVPAAVSALGDVLVGAGLLIAMITTIQNGYAAANVTVESEQQVVSTGLYSLVRHPMYFGNVVLMIGVPLALGSYWALLFVIPGLVILVARIRDEESLLTSDLNGYGEYTRRVRFRLVPYIW